VETNKRYADSIDRRAAERPSAAQSAIDIRQDPTAAVRDWKPPWPPICVAENEWIIMRNSQREPVGVIRALRMGPRDELFYRVVTWAQTSEGRTLVGYYQTLDEADRSILFVNPSPRCPTSAPPPGTSSPEAR
jgi:hypothetical protein